MALIAQQYGLRNLVIRGSNSAGWVRGQSITSLCRAPKPWNPTGPPACRAPEVCRTYCAALRDAHTSIHVWYIYIYICMYVCMYVCVYIYIYIYIYIYVHIIIYSHIYIYIYTHTHTHIYRWCCGPPSAGLWAASSRATAWASCWSPRKSMYTFSLSLYISLSIYVYICTYVYVYSYILI